MREDESVEVSVRRAREEDYAEIVEVHCSDVDKWYRYSEGEKIEASYEELTPFERWLHGGPWMDERALRIHFEILRECGGEAFVAVSGGRVVGEAEVVFGEELEPYGRYCFLEVLVVHRDCRRRGVGTKLVEHCIEYARARGYSRFDAVPEDRRSRRVYSKLGLERMSYLCKMEKECKRASPPLSLEETSLEEHPWGMLLVSGHWYPSVYVWQNLARSTEYNRLEGFRLERPRAFEIRDRERATGILVLQRHPTNPSLCIVYAWIEPERSRAEFLREVAESAESRARDLGYERVFVEVDEERAPAFLEAGYAETRRVEYMRRVEPQEAKA